jgi:beta-galactosidase
MNRRSFLKLLTALTGALGALTSRPARVRLLAATLPQHRRAGHRHRRRRPESADFQPPASKRQDIDLDDNWQFIRADVSGAEQIDFDDSAWSTIGVPHTWNNLDGEQHTNYYRGVGWYRRHYAIDAGLAGMNFYLQFDGANLATDVYVNGSFVGEHKGGYARFRFDVTAQINAGADNVIAVKVNNARDADVPPLDADFTFFGGLYRPVHLLVTDPLQVQTLDYGSSGVYVTPINVSAASTDLMVTTEVVNSAQDPKSVTVTTYVVDGEGNLVTTFAATRDIDPGSACDFALAATIDSPRLWNGRADPHVYTAHVTVSDGSSGDVVNDLVSQPFGVRFFSIDPDTGFVLNGSCLDLHGVNRHQDRLHKGWAITPEDQEEDFGLIYEMGATSIRLAHYQHDQHFYDLADENGLVVWAEIPLINRITASDAFYANAQQQLLELIRQNYNHPGIVFWSISNEVTAPGPDPNPLLQILADLARSEDSSRLSTLAAAAGASDATTRHTDVVGFNRYYGWYYGSYSDFAGWADQTHAGFPNQRFAVSEYGAGSSIVFHSDAPARMDHTEEYQNLFHEAHWLAMKTRPYLWGKFVWNMFDFASAGRNEGDTPGRNDKGLVTYDRQTRKDAFYWYKANWSSDPVLYITGRRFTDRVDAIADIKVYSNADAVEVRLNGASLGVQSGPDHLFIWSGATLGPGDNVVEAFATIGGTTFTDTVTWTLRA